jgi:hypothetical protein
VSLDRDLEAIARLALHLPEAERVALAGGGAMLVHGLVNRPTQDIDLFTPDPAELARLVPALVAALRQQGYDVHLDRSTPTFTRLQVTTPAGRVLVVDLGQDWRMRAAVELDVGRVLHAEETAADKVLALFDRATARDLIDVDALTRHYSHDRLLALAGEKDSGCSGGSAPPARPRPRSRSAIRSW